MGIVNEPIENGVGVGRISDRVMPGGYGQLTGDDGRAAPVSLLEDFEEIMTGLSIERLECPVVQNQEFDAGEGSLHARIAAVAARQCQVGEETRGALVKN